MYTNAPNLPTNGTSPITFETNVKSIMSIRRARAFMSHGTGLERDRLNDEFVGVLLELEFEVG